MVFILLEVTFQNRETYIPCSPGIQTSPTTTFRSTSKRPLTPTTTFRSTSKRPLTPTTTFRSTSKRPLTCSHDLI